MFKKFKPKFNTVNKVGAKGGPKPGDAIAKPLQSTSDSEQPALATAPASGLHKNTDHLKSGISESGDHLKLPQVTGQHQPDLLESVGSPKATPTVKLCSPRTYVSSEYPTAVNEVLQTTVSSAGSDTEAVVDASSPSISNTLIPVVTSPVQLHSPRKSSNSEDDNVAGQVLTNSISLTGDGTNSHSVTGVDSQSRSQHLAGKEKKIAAHETPEHDDAEACQRSQPHRDRPEENGQSKDTAEVPNQPETVSGDETPAAQSLNARQVEDVSDSASVSTGGLTDEQGDSLSETPKVPRAKKIRRPKPVLPSTEGPPEWSKMRISDLIYWNPSQNHMKKKESSIGLPTETISTSVEEETVQDSPAVETEMDQDEELPVPQLRVGADGSIIINDTSLIMEDKNTDTVHTAKEIVEEDEDRYVTCNSFRNNTRPKRWSIEETKRFYKALSLVGTDFSMMCEFFPRRDRKQLKNKFNKEDRKNRQLVDQTLKNIPNTTYDSSVYEKILMEDEAEKRKEEALEEKKKKKKEERMKKAQKEKEAALRETDDSLEKDSDGREQEERKENRRKRKNGKLFQDGKKLSGYKKRKVDQAQTGHAEEVADILVNMSQGKVRAGAESSQATVNDNISDTLSVASDLDTAQNSVFVPKVARAAEPMKETSCRNVVVDPEMSVIQWSVPDNEETTVSLNAANSSAADLDGSAPRCIGPAEIAQNVQGNIGNLQNVTQEVSSSQLVSEDVSTEHKHRTASAEVVNNPLIPLTSNTDLTTNPVVPSLSEEHVLSFDVQSMDGASTETVANQSCSSVIESDEASISSYIEQLRSQSSTPCDVVFVEHVDGQSQGIVHVYLVPRAMTQGEGEAGSSVQGDGTAANSAFSDGGDLGNGGTLP